MFPGVRLTIRTIKFYYCGVASTFIKPRQSVLLRENTTLTCAKRTGFPKTETSSFV